ncbi:MAG: hypothetical protein EBW73_05260, partial [Betaproteobacteria bacterium]|nr:hypothetical protein [Betaproteobacteria bacterium]
MPFKKTLIFGRSHTRMYTSTGQQHPRSLRGCGRHLTTSNPRGFGLLATGLRITAGSRLAVGLDAQRLALLLAVLHRHAGIACHDQDVFLNAVGGVRITEPAADLASLFSIVSSFKNRAIGKGIAVFGEVGLAGEIRPCPRGQDRIREAAKLGYRRLIVPKANV